MSRDFYGIKDRIGYFLFILQLLCSKTRSSVVVLLCIAFADSIQENRCE